MFLACQNIGMKHERLMSGDSCYEHTIACVAPGIYFLFIMMWRSTAVSVLLRYSKHCNNTGKKLFLQ